MHINSRLYLTAALKSTACTSTCEGGSKSAQNFRPVRKSGTVGTKVGATIRIQVYQSFNLEHITTAFTEAVANRDGSLSWYIEVTIAQS